MDPKDLQTNLFAVFSKLGEEKQAEFRLSLNQFYQDRIEKLRTRLWGTLTWLAAAQGAALLLIVKEGGLRTVKVLTIKMEEPTLVLLVAFFGFILAIYMLAIILDGHKHLHSNFENSDRALDLSPPAPNSSADQLCEKRKKPPAGGKLAGIKWIFGRPANMEPSLKIMRILALAAGALDLLLVIIGGVGVWQWATGKDVPYILIGSPAPT